MSRTSGVRSPAELFADPFSSTRRQNYVMQNEPIDVFADERPAVAPAPRPAPAPLGKDFEGLFRNPDPNDFSLFDGDLSARPRTTSVPGMNIYDPKPVDDRPARADTIYNREDFIKMRAAAGGIEAIGGVLNANARFSQFQGQARFATQMARNQINEIRSNMASERVREEVKGESRAGQAKIAAAAQGQSATGDLANSLVASEEVAAAQNIMRMEINAMREIFGVESQIRNFTSQTNQARISRDLEMINSVAQGGASVLGSL